MKLNRARALELFRSLKAKDPETWAAGEVDDDHPMLARYLFLSGVWRAVLPDDAVWKGGSPPAARLLAKGGDPRDLAAVVRQAQIDLLYEIYQLLDDSSHGIEDLQEQIPEIVQWRLCEVDSEEKPTGRVLLDIHASFGKFDPTGRNGEPPPEPAKASSKSRKRQQR